MLDRIQQIIFPNQLSSFQVTKLNELLNTYTEEQILNVYEEYGDKPLQYIKKVLETKKNKKKEPEWVKSEVVNEELDKETQEVFDDFQNFLEEFRNANF